MLNQASKQSHAWRALLIVAVVAVVTSITPAARSTAAEPASEFLEALRSRGYYDMAVLYLERMENSQLVDTSFKQVLPYEQGATLAMAAKYERDFAARAKMLDDANAALAKFVKDNPRHKLTSAANNQLGNLLVERARMMIEKAGKPSGAGQKTELLKEAGELFDEAHKVFTDGKATIERELKGIKPNLDPEKDADEIAYRDELRKQFLQAQLLSAAVLEEKAEAAIANKKQYEELLTKAGDEYKEIYEKYRTRLAGLYARLYQGRCYQKIAEHKDASKADQDKNYKEALSYYNDLLDQPDDPTPFRALKTKTLLLAIDSWIATGKVDAAVNKGLEWVEKMRPNEAVDLEWIELQLKVAKALKQHADSVQDAAQKREFLKTARKLAETVAKTKTDYKTDAQKLLLTLGGGDPDAEVEQKVAKNFLEAKEFGKEALDRMQANDFAIKNLPARIKAEKDSGVKAELEKQLAEANEGVSKNRQLALNYFNQAIGLANAETSTDDLNVVRYFLCYLNYVEQNYYRSAIIGEFLARRYPNSAGAKPSSKIAMAAYLKLYKEAEKGERDFETRQAVGIAKYITERWPEAPEATEALNTLIPFMIQAGDLDKAMDYVAKVPEDSPVRGEAELKTGQAMWSRYLREVYDLKKAVAEGNPPADKSAKEAELEELKTKAQEVLANGIERMRKAATVDSTLATAVLSLAQIYVDLAQYDKALPMLEDPNIGVLVLVVKKDPATERPGFEAETYKTALRAYIGSLATTSDADITITKARGVMQSLANSVGDDAEGQQRLVAIYISLAKDLEKQLEISDEQSKQALSKGFETFLDEVKNSATRFDVLNWVAETFYSLGTGFDDNTGALDAQARGYYQNAIDTYDRILAKQKSDSSYMPKPELALQVRMRMATVLKRMGEYQKAIDQFAAILTEKKSMLNVQVEAALTFQEWGDNGGGNDKYIKAMQGDKKGADGKDIIWGWGQLSQVTSRYLDKFASVFHDSRYNLALCYYMMANDRTLSNAKKLEYLGKAKRYISATYRIYPELGGPERTARYNSLLKRIQKDLGEPTAGLKAFDTQTAAASS